MVLERQEIIILQLQQQQRVVLVGMLLIFNLIPLLITLAELFLAVAEVVAVVLVQRPQEL